MRYAIWNNKGGVGKTFLSFVLSTEYAAHHPKKKVLLVDMCPQANLSEIVLGGNGTGGKNLAKILTAEKRQTIGGYFDERIRQPHQITGNETSYLINAKEYNEKLPDNLYLICGDPSLEVQSQAINQLSAISLPTDSWKNVHLWLSDLVIACMKKMSSNAEGFTAFIDCNPSFSSYTELALIASDRLIVPCTSDGSSARAIDNLFALLFGEGNGKLYAEVNFSTKTKTFGLPLPVIHRILLNRSTQYDKSASKAFRLMFEEVTRRVKRYQNSIPKAFVSQADCYADIPDGHSVAVVASHEGAPLSKVKQGPHSIYDETVQINSDPLKRYQTAIAGVVDEL